MKAFLLSSSPALLLPALWGSGGRPLRPSAGRRPARSPCFSKSKKGTWGWTHCVWGQHGERGRSSPWPWWPLLWCPDGHLQVTFGSWPLRASRRGHTCGAGAVGRRGWWWVPPGCCQEELVLCKAPGPCFRPGEDPLNNQIVKYCFDLFLFIIF